MSATTSETLFWNKFSSSATSNEKHEQRYLPPWLRQDTLPYLNENGIEQVAAVLNAGLAFRKALHDVAARKRQVKREQEKNHHERVERIQYECEAALTKNRDRHSFISGVRRFRTEVEKYREIVTKLENSLSNKNNNNKNNKNEIDLEHEADDPDQTLINSRRDAFNKLCNETTEKWQEFLSLSSFAENQTISDQVQKQIQSPSPPSSSFINKRPPWQLKCAAELDPFSPPQTEQAKVTFDGGKILDRFGRDVWEDRCYALGVTIQCGVSVGVGEERYRSTTRKNCVRSALWHKWVEKVAAHHRERDENDEKESWIVSPNLSAGETDDEIRFEIHDDCGGACTSPESSRTPCRCRIIDPFIDDFFVKCNNQRVMAFLDLSEMLDDQKRVPSRNDRLRTATLESFKSFRNFPFLRRTIDRDQSQQFQNHNHNHDNNKNNSFLRNYFTFSQVEKFACKILKSFISFYQEPSTTTTKNATNPRFRCVAGLITDPFLFFLIDIACVSVGVCFVGLHTSWSTEDIERSVTKIVKPDLIVTDDVAMVEVINSMKLDRNDDDDDDDSAISQHKSCHVLFLSTEQILSRSSNQAVDEIGDEESSLENLINRNKDKLFKESLIDEKFHFDIALNDDDTTKDDKNIDDNDDASTTNPQQQNGNRNQLQLLRPFTLMFSSGTSGNLKAVEVPCENWIATNFKQQRYEMDPLSIVSFNAMAHGLDRGLCWTALFNAGRVCFLQTDKAQRSLEDEKKKLAAEFSNKFMMNNGKSNTMNESNILNLLPDFFCATHLCSPSLLVASPDLWTALYKVLKESEVVKEAFACCAELMKNSSSSSSSSFSIFETEKYLMSEREDCIPASLLRAKQLIQFLFGKNFRQAATGAAPISPQVVEFFQKIFSSAFFIDVDADVPQKLRRKVLLEDEKKSKENTQSDDNKNAQVEDKKQHPPQVPPLFFDVYGSTEAPGISTNHVIRSGLEVALAKVSGYELFFCNNNNNQNNNHKASSTSSQFDLYGELLVRGTGVTKKYHNDEKSSNESFVREATQRGGLWYRTGDVVKLQIVSSKTLLNDGASCDLSSLTVPSSLMMVGCITEEQQQQRQREQIMTPIHILKKELISSTKLFVVDRVKDLIELYVDHQSAWVPASKVEEMIMMNTTSKDDNNDNNNEEDIEILLNEIYSTVGAVGVDESSHSSSSSSSFVVRIEQVAVFGDRMLPFLAAVVGVSIKVRDDDDDDNDKGKINKTNEEKSSNSPPRSAKLEQILEERILKTIQDRIRRHCGGDGKEIPGFWIPEKVILYEMTSSGESTATELTSNSPSRLFLPRTIERWVAGGEFRTHLGKIRRGILAKHLRNDLAVKPFS